MHITAPGYPCVESGNPASPSARAVSNWLMRFLCARMAAHLPYMEQAAALIRHRRERGTESSVERQYECVRSLLGFMLDDCDGYLPAANLGAQQLATIFADEEVAAPDRGQLPDWLQALAEQLAHATRTRIELCMCGESLSVRICAEPHGEQASQVESLLLEFLTHAAGHLAGVSAVIRRESGVTMRAKDGSGRSWLFAAPAALQ
jgi:hypothetical protein